MAPVNETPVIVVARDEAHVRELVALHRRDALDGLALLPPFSTPGVHEVFASINDPDVNPSVREAAARILRLDGWEENEDSRSCDSCGLYSWDEVPEAETCYDCGDCRECAEKNTDGGCSECRSATSSTLKA